ncbi:MAG: BtpA/SgcQ family protein [Planctomycetes bacterium]|nr:BtpA/SgcQ family protein [Planctomycetota bacterium]
MTRPLLPAWNGVPHPVIAMLHAPALPGSPRYGGDLADVAARVLSDAETLVAGGVHGLLLENFGDMPFFPDRVPALVVAHLTRLAHELRQRFDLPLGINVLRNDGSSALAIAHASGAAWIRVNVLCGARVTDQGLLQGIAHRLLRERAALAADEIRILADVDVKHSAPAGPARPLAEEVHDLVERGGADAVIVSGSGTGRATALEEVRQVRAAAGDTPVLVGSGVTSQTIADYLPHADGFIVGTALKVDGVPGNPVDGARVRALMERLQ